MLVKIRNTYNIFNVQLQDHLVRVDRMELRDLEDREGSLDQREHQETVEHRDNQAE